ncbi:MAG: hypothetical protein Q8Q00_09155 [Dehalococcoidia bacterium]|nr:hypothetical protein [Dehalococcoidia bacterium]
MEPKDGFVEANGIAGGSHFVPMEQPEAIAAEALAFLEGAAPAA